MADSFDAELRLLATDEGGRQTPLGSGYRSLVRLNDESSEEWGVEVTFTTPDSLAPGATATVTLRRLANDGQGATPSAGTPLFLYEGTRLVGTGTVS